MKMRSSAVILVFCLFIPAAQASDGKPGRVYAVQAAECPAPLSKEGAWIYNRGWGTAHIPRALPWAGMSGPSGAMSGPVASGAIPCPFADAVSGRRASGNSPPMHPGAGPARESY